MRIHPAAEARDHNHTRAHYTCVCAAQPPAATEILARIDMQYCTARPRICPCRTEIQGKLPEEGRKRVASDRTQRRKSLTTSLETRANEESKEKCGRPTLALARLGLGPCGRRELVHLKWRPNAIASCTPRPCFRRGARSVKLPVLYRQTKSHPKSPSSLLISSLVCKLLA